MKWLSSTSLPTHKGRILPDLDIACEVDVNWQANRAGCLFRIQVKWLEEVSCTVWPLLAKLWHLF